MASERLPASYNESCWFAGATVPAAAPAHAYCQLPHLTCLPAAGFAAALQVAGGEAQGQGGYLWPLARGSTLFSMHGCDQQGGTYEVAVSDIQLRQLCTGLFYLRVTKHVSSVTKNLCSCPRSARSSGASAALPPTPSARSAEPPAALLSL